MKKLFLAVLVIVLAGTLLLSACAGPAPTPAPAPAPVPAPAPKPAPVPESAAEFYKKNVVTMIVGYAAGGGSDYAGRILASFWPDATDGGAMIVKNMVGGGGLVACNFVYSAKPDGLTINIGMQGSSYTTAVIFKDPAAKYDAHKFNYLVGVFSEPWGLYGSAKRPYASFEDLKKVKGLKFAALGPDDPSSLLTAVVIETAGLEGAQIITGYKGGADSALAAGKGEVDATILPRSVGDTGIGQGFVKLPFAFLSFEKNAIYPNTPPFPELVKLTPEQKALFELVHTITFVSRIAAAPPGVPVDRVKFMRDAFAKIVTIDGLKQQAKTIFPLGTTPMIGDEVTAFIEKAVKIEPGPIQALVKKYMAIK